MRAPLVVVVTGMPAAGKTTIAGALSRDLGLPLVSRDKIKERLYDTLGVGDLEWSGRLGGAAFALLFDSARLMTESGHSVMLEATSFAGPSRSSPRFRRTARFRFTATRLSTFSWRDMRTEHDIRGTTMRRH